MSAWAFLVGNFAQTAKDCHVFDEALEEIRKEERHHYDSALLSLVWQWINEVNSGHGSSVGELMYRLERVGYSRPACRCAPCTDRPKQPPCEGCTGDA